ncbi:hypothetical protein [Streptomyces albipurpureus]|uniref:DUF3592 domain-containing protein n=1 Tax=Streptomyces albipurpureus TaxID=2897419 RepID=A0ABT0UU03_9ACTN|nr:hypothetical protein [Streptomyces sp. CWNU-1]MCM2390833.1 hypothetical protein [Streptomyces sp. CWNU-1]
MTSNPVPPRLPSVALRGRSESLWLEGGAILLEQRGVRRRIPLKAVREIRVGAAGQRSVEVVLTAAEGTLGTVYRIDCRNERAVAAFADAVNGALPVQGHTPHRDGKRLVEVLPRSAATGWGAMDRSMKTILLVCVGTYATGLVTMFLLGDMTNQLSWGLGFMPLFLGVSVAAIAGRNLYDRVVLSRRGITATATFHGKRGKEKLFSYIDVEGRKRRVVLPWKPFFVDGVPKRVQVTYDPQRPEFSVVALPLWSWVFRTIGFLGLGLPLLVLGLFMVPYQLIDVLFL